MNPIRSWFRRILPHEGIFLAALSVCLIPEVLFLATRPGVLWDGVIVDETVVIVNGTISVAAVFAQGVHQANVAFVLLAVISLGVWRVWGFHPLFRPEYRRWLQSTPWTADLPLPNGPVHLTLQDGALLLAATLLIWWLHPELPAFHVVLIFLVAYEGILAASMAVLKVRRHAYSAAFGLALVVVFWSPATAHWALLTAAVVHFDLQVGLRRALARMDEWQELSLVKLSDSGNVPEDRRQNNRGVIGWPMEAFRPDRKFAGIPVLDGALLCLLAGWWANALILAIERAERTRHEFPVMGMVMFLLNLAIVARLGIYLGGFAPPISLAGRIATRKWIIPGYDLVLAMPLASIAILGVFGFVQRRYGLDPRLSAACMTTLALAPLLMGGPSLRDWQLTGHYRLSPFFSTSRNTGDLRVS